MSLLPILLYPDPVLREKCAEVDVFDEELATLVADMIETMHEAPGVGLAAPQVGVGRRVAVVDTSVGEDPAELHVLVNPRLAAHEGSESDLEGCLSIPDFTEKVDRPARIAIEAQGTDGEPFTLEAEGFLARAICHEIDHLDGILFTDRLKGLRRERGRRHLRRLSRAREMLK